MVQRATRVSTGSSRRVIRGDTRVEKATRDEMRRDLHGCNVSNAFEGGSGTSICYD